jgi:hypothetical protein
MDVSVAGRRWPWFVAWTVPGASLVLSLSALALITFPLAILAVLLLRPRSDGRERLGLLAGGGIAVAAIGSLHATYRACTAAPHIGGSAYSCGGVDGPRWLMVGIAATIAAAVLYWLTARHSSTAAP